MSNTPNSGLITPDTGSLVGTWGSAALNPNFVAIDGMQKGFATVSLTNANVTLTGPSGSIVPGPGPTQSQNSLIVFTGTLTGNCTITFPLPGQYNILNSCVVGAFYVQLSGGSGNKIGVPPGQSISVFSNGTNMQFISLPPPGSYWDYAGSTVPAWIGACTVAPWKACDGSILNIADWPQLYAVVGTAYGGNGLTTFALPDARNRAFYMIDMNQGGLSNRITAAGSGINGAALGGAGGDQLSQVHTHGVVDPGHLHGTNLPIFKNVVNPGFSATDNILSASPAGGGTQITVQTATTGISLNTFGSGASQNMPPAFIGGIRFIRMG